ncbi:hypothetical protein [Mangrovibacillus cuniculi]|uniref:Uncharacterized protein n=1 Tax=Mangrovibacillus cuniculi TaxID=2593652 RepID=A0A7S8HES0_9BACI|nr:hypothetical protein [Mangrovibacillus cuniculi]QPC46159.1 hypothetical protein G8O30_03885 [Mangrovibacillus cuniculi]
MLNKLTLICILALTLYGSLITTSTALYYDNKSLSNSFTTLKDIKFYFIFSSSGSEVATGINEELKIDLGNTSLISTITKSYSSSFTIINKGPSTTLEFQIISLSKPASSVINCTSVLTVNPSTIPANSTIPVTIDFQIFSLLGVLGGQYEGIVRVKDVNTDLTYDIPISFSLSLI